jgi:hypothetical protein
MEVEGFRDRKHKHKLNHKALEEVHKNNLLILNCLNNFFNNSLEGFGGFSGSQAQAQSQSQSFGGGFDPYYG